MTPFDDPFEFGPFTPDEEETGAKPPKKVVIRRRRAARTRAARCRR